MPDIAFIRAVVGELLSRDTRRRIPEKEVMDDEANVEGFTLAGLDEHNSIMAPVYLFHAAQISDVIAPGDTVVDLGSGPANQLALVARLNPECRFIGVEASPKMIQQAQTHIGDLGVTNVEFMEGDFTNLEKIADASVDAVYSTMTLHQLQSVEDLTKAFSEVARILKNDGGLYLVDFGHLKSVSTMHYFAHQYADRQPQAFTDDYLNSLWAAFHKFDFQSLAQRFLYGRATVYSTFGIQYMVAVKSPSRQTRIAELQQSLQDMQKGLADAQRTDFKNLCGFFRAGGLSSRLLR